VARIYVGGPGSVWGKPDFNAQEEMRSYQADFDTMKDQFSDVEFVVDQMVSSPRQVEEIKDRLGSADGILVIQLPWITTDSYGNPQCASAHDGFRYSLFWS